MRGPLQVVFWAHDEWDWGFRRFAGSIRFLYRWALYLGPVEIRRRAG